jgi:hypothetical protein
MLKIFECPRCYKKCKLEVYQNPKTDIIVLPKACPFEGREKQTNNPRWKHKGGKYD